MSFRPHYINGSGTCLVCTRHFPPGAKTTDECPGNPRVKPIPMLVVITEKIVLTSDLIAPSIILEPGASIQPNGFRVGKLEGPVSYASDNGIPVIMGRSR